jgi:hypothetical protein
MLLFEGTRTIGEARGGRTFWRLAPPGRIQETLAADGSACCPSRPVVGRVSPSAPRGAEIVQNVGVRAIADGALGETRPTFKCADDLGNPPGSRCSLLRWPSHSAPTAVAGYDLVES